MSLNLYDIFFGFSQQLVLELFGHLHIEELLQGSLDGHGALPVPLLHLVAELIPVVKLFDLFEVCLVIAVAEERTLRCQGWRENDTQTSTNTVNQGQ